MQCRFNEIGWRADAAAAVDVVRAYVASMSEAQNKSDAEEVGPTASEQARKGESGTCVPTLPW